MSATKEALEMVEQYLVASLIAEEMAQILKDPDLYTGDNFFEAQAALVRVQCEWIRAQEEKLEAARYLRSVGIIS